MDFIARAGSLVDRGHRVIGILLVVIVCQMLWIKSEREDNARLQATIHKQNMSQSIYVVPNSQANIYKPADRKLLLVTFVDYVTQSLLTYTPASFKPQYSSIRPFFSSTLLALSEEFYEREIKKAETDSISSLFVADRTSTELSDITEVNVRKLEAEKRRELKDRTYRDPDYISGSKRYEITIKGKRHFIVGGTSVQTQDIAVTLNLQETTVSQTNPFGFIITKWTFSKSKN